MERKRCSRCHQDLPVADFGTKRYRGALRPKSQCRSCSRKVVQAIRQRRTTWAEFTAWGLVEPGDSLGCWVWAGATFQRGGYGMTPTSKLAHRASYEAHNDITLSRSDVVHHTCHNRLCVRPNHLQLVTSGQNSAEMLERQSYKARIAELEAEVHRLKSM